MAQFVFCVIHAKAREESWLFPAEPGEALAIVTSKSFPVETTMHPSWTGCALAPDEFDNNVVDYNNWSVHQRKCAIENRQWYNQACVEKLNRTAGANVARYYGNTADHVRALEQSDSTSTNFWRNTGAFWSRTSLRRFPATIFYLRILRIPGTRCRAEELSHAKAIPASWLGLVHV
jgi:hypothetical protein